LKKDKAALKETEAERDALSQKIVAMGYEPVKEFTKEDRMAQRQARMKGMLARRALGGYVPYKPGDPVVTNLFHFGDD